MRGDSVLVVGVDMTAIRAHDFSVVFRHFLEERPENLVASFAGKFDILFAHE